MTFYPHLLSVAIARMTVGNGVDVRRQRHIPNCSFFAVHGLCVDYDVMVLISCWLCLTFCFVLFCVVQVTISRSQSGKQAIARAVLRETGHLIGVRLKDCGSK